MGSEICSGIQVITSTLARCTGPCNVYQPPSELSSKISAMTIPLVYRSTGIDSENLYHRQSSSLKPLRTSLEVRQMIEADSV